MTEVEIDDLLAIGNDQESSANTIIQQNGITFKAPTRPNPPGQINVTSQAQLEAELGTDIQITDSTNMTIVIDGTFTLTKPIKVGNGSGLEIRSSRVGPTINYTGPGAMIQNIVPGVDESFFVFGENLIIAGDTTNSFLDVKLASNGFFTLIGVNLTNFASIGTVDSPSVSLTRFTAFTITQGLVILNATQVIVNIVVLGNFSVTNTTWFTIITNGAPFVTFDGIVAFNFSTGDSLFFFDPNAPADTTFNVTTSRISTTEDFYQTGADLTVSSVVDVGGLAEFLTSVPNALSIGTPVVLSGFAESTYNGTFIVESISTPTEFILRGVAFAGGDSGIANESSLDQTNPLVIADNNTGSPSSQTLSETRIPNGTVITTFGFLSQGNPIPITNSPAVPGDWEADPTIERFSLATDGSGLVTYIGKEIITAMLKYNVEAIATTGPSQTLDITLEINGILQTKATISLETGGSFVPAAYSGGNFVLNPGDTIQLLKTNFTNENDTDFQNTTILINK